MKRNLHRMRIFVMISSLTLIVCALSVVLIVHYWTHTEAGRVPPKTAVVLQAINENLVTTDMKAPQFLTSSGSARFTREYVEIPVADGSTITSKMYRPIEGDSHPIILYYHGGAFMEGYGDIETHDNIVRALATRTNSIVIAVGYRVAPTYPFPTAIEDSYDALNWAYMNAFSIGGDPNHISVAGDSAGGNIATVVSLMSRDRNGPDIQSQALFYPLTTFQDVDFDSRYKYDSGYYLLSRSVMLRARDTYTPQESLWSHAYTSPLNADLEGLPPAIVITAEFDPLRDEGEEYARRLAESGVPVVNYRYNGVMHGFVSFYEVMYRGNHALAEAALFLRTTDTSTESMYQFQVFDGATNTSIQLREEAEAYAIGTFLIGKKALSLFYSIVQ
ncbi:alpha/beta hydrolase [Halalkalibacter sp. APA_J-10(15)]|uniref:alpha/beta hydrolase n=1 Tax=Halalkalibacter sp. APA_J-10(15) TaxID=2933805 RepID=UPI001FF3FFFD|nr:alpha/beta hydrolase [Halalkalibacter sp. APA_J-10(15)]MCK0471921.1 alpha/beta hydrolase [Halalkalibacter sp. APA_J-10(15)]